VFASRLPHGLGFIPLGLGFIIWGFFTRPLICAICVLVSFLGLSLAMNGVALLTTCRLVVCIKHLASGLLHLNPWTHADVFLRVLRRRYVASAASVASIDVIVIAPNLCIYNLIDGKNYICFYNWFCP